MSSVPIDRLRVGDAVARKTIFESDVYLFAGATGEEPVTI
jgi:hypothetical protein